MLHPLVHNHYLTQIKRLLGASFVGWVQEKKSKHLKIVINKREMILPFEGGDIIGEDSYRELIKNIIQNAGGQIQEPLRVHVEEQGTEAVDA